MPISRRKPYAYKAQLSAVEHAFCCGAIIGGGASLKEVFEHLPPNTITTSEKAEESGLKELLSLQQKKEIIKIVTSCRNNREKESWQAIKDNDFKNIAPDISISLFKSIMYKAGYSRRKPGWKPPLTQAQKKERLMWALDHNPDLEEEYDNKGYNFRQVRGIIRTWCKEDEVLATYIIMRHRKKLSLGRRQEHSKCLMRLMLTSVTTLGSFSMSRNMITTVVSEQGVHLRRLFPRFKTLKDKVFYVFYLKMELLHISHVLPTTTLLLKR
ncbi:hypothetical protein CC86DRAFT_444883 [Ophiobolus disseminans]|uniref:Transposase Tc1-like domain-containing protein n=1 Tax=Ophiobolus disseminans TaxID=1469910 RepID=A0A6A7A676_9PLEO|nr:hypothetical protein CC86DRAFT_444883 [Ophiobolus disseminans]